MAILKPKLEGLTLTTGLVRLSYAFLSTPKVDGFGKQKYSTAIIIPKSDKETIALIHKAFEAAKLKGFEKGKLTKLDIEGKKPLKHTLRDGDESDDAAYEGAYYMNVSNSEKPALRDRKGNAIEDPSELYSGCYARVVLSFFAYNSDGSKGLSASIEGVQKVKDGENLGGTIDADDFLDAIDGEDGDDPLLG